jgi:hypothetical protein
VSPYRQRRQRPKSVRRSVNVHRRQLTREQRRELVARLRADGKSYPEIGKALGMSTGQAHADAKAFSSENLLPVHPGRSRRTPTLHVHVAGSAREVGR